MKLFLLIGVVAATLGGCAIVPYGYGYDGGARYYHRDGYHHRHYRGDDGYSRNYRYHDHGQ